MAPLIALAHTASSRIIACGGGIGARLNPGGVTICELWNCETEFTHVRLGAMNDSAAPVGFGPLAVAAAADLSPDPVDAAGRPQTLRPVTFPGGRVRRLIPPEPDLLWGGPGWRPSLGFSDWVALDSVPRRDGGPGRLLQVRALLRAGSRGPGAGSYATTQADPRRFTGRSYETFFQPGDALAGGAMRRAPDAQGAGVVYTVQWRTRAAGTTLQMVGDSIGQGIGSGNAYANFGLLACAAVSSPERPVHFLQSAVGGARSVDFIAAAGHDLQAGPIGIACVQTWSGNDVSAAMSPAAARAAADAAWQRAVQCGAALRARGGVPIYLSAVPQPVRCPTPALEAARLSSVARCHGLAARGEFVLDLNGILGDGRTPCDYRAAFLTDHFHPSDSGQRAVAALLATQIRAIIGVRSP